jgi:hypothetical protein
MNDYTIIGWRAWYVSESGEVVRYCSSTTRWTELPSHGCLGYVTYCKTRPYRNIRVGVSWYWHDPKTQVYGADDAKDALIPPELDKARWVKRGKWVEETVWRRVSEEIERALTAPNEGQRIDKVR